MIRPKDSTSFLNLNEPKINSNEPTPHSSQSIPTLTEFDKDDAELDIPDIPEIPEITSSNQLIRHSPTSKSPKKDKKPPVSMIVKGHDVSFLIKSFPTKHEIEEKDEFWEWDNEFNKVAVKIQVSGIKLKSNDEPPITFLSQSRETKING